MPQTDERQTVRVLAVKASRQRNPNSSLGRSSFRELQVGPCLVPMQHECEFRMALTSVSAQTPVVWKHVHSRQDA